MTRDQRHRFVRGREKRPTFQPFSYGQIPQEIELLALIIGTRPRQAALRVSGRCAQQLAVLPQYPDRYTPAAQATDNAQPSVVAACNQSSTAGLKAAARSWGGWCAWDRLVGAHVVSGAGETTI